MSLAWLIENEATYSSRSPSILPVDRLTRCTRVHTAQVTLSQVSVFASGAVSAANP